MKLFLAFIIFALLVARPAFAKALDFPAHCISNNNLFSIDIEEDSTTHKLYGHLFSRDSTDDEATRDIAYIDISSHSPFVDTYTAVEFYLAVRNPDPALRNCGTESNRLCTGRFEGNIHGKHRVADLKCFKNLY